MKSIAFFILITLGVGAYAAVDVQSMVLFDTYMRYQQEVNEDNIVAVADNYFSPALLGESFPAEPDSVSQLLFSNYMKRVEGHHEAKSPDEGCLVINGYDKQNDPVVFNVKYIPIKDDWLIDKIHVVFVESSTDFTDRAECPAELPD